MYGEDIRLCLMFEYFSFRTRALYRKEGMVCADCDHDLCLLPAGEFVFRMSRIIARLPRV